MKKILYLAALAAAALFAVSCDGNEGGTTENVDNEQILGTWYMAGEEYHPCIPTFKANGEYEWEYGGITGLKDTGTYTMSGNVITMTIKKFWYIDGEFNWETGVYEGNWVEETDNLSDRSRTRTCTVYVVEDDMMIWGVFNDWFYWNQDDEMLLFMSRDAHDITVSQPLTSSDLEGEWLNKAKDGTLKNRLIVKGSNFTMYSLVTNYTFIDGSEEINYYTEKHVGTVEIEDGHLVVNHTHSYYGIRSIHNEETGAWTYEFSEYDPETLESNEWLSEDENEWSEEFLIFRDGQNLYFGTSFGGYAWTKK